MWKHLDLSAQIFLKKNLLSFRIIMRSKVPRSLFPTIIEISTNDLPVFEVFEYSIKRITMSCHVYSREQKILNKC